MSGSADAGRLLVRIEATTAQLRQQLAAAEKQVSGTATRLDTELKKGDKAFGRLNEASRAAQQSVAGLTARLGPLGGALTSLGPVGLAAGVALGTIGAALIPIAQAGDRATASLARLSAATGSLAQARDVYQSLFELSQQTGVAVADSAGAFTRFSIAAKEVGGTNEQVLKLIGGIQKAGIVTGATSQEISSFAIQFAQALASGVLQGDELRAMIESMPAYAAALAKQLGVGVGELKKMGSEGRLIAADLLPAAVAAAEDFSAAFEQMPRTMSQAAGVLKSSTDEFLARLDNIVNASGLFRDAMLAGAAALNAMSRFANPTPREAAESGLASAQERLAQVQKQVADERNASAYGSISPAFTEALRLAEEAVVEHRLRLFEIQSEAIDRGLKAEDEGARKAAEAARKASDGQVTALRQSLNPRLKLEEEHAAKVAEIRSIAARGLITEAEETALVTAANEKLAKAIDGITGANKARVASAREVAKAETAAQKAGEKAAAGARASQEKARREAEQAVERFNREIARESERVADDIATNLFDSITDPSRATSVLDFFQNIFRRIAIQALSANIILPITTAVMGGAPGMFGITPPGGVAGVGGLGGLASLLPSGITGLGGLELISPAARYISPIGEAGTSIGGLTLGGALSGLGLGAGAGGLLASLTGGNAIGGTVGGGLGGLGGSLLGAIPAVAGFLGPLAPFAGLIGGLLGGGLGGLIGPKPSVQGYGFRLQSAGFDETQNRNEFGDELLDVDRKFFNASGAAAFDQADTLVERVNAYLQERGLQVGGVSIVGGNKDGADYSSADAGNLSEAFDNLRFRSKDNDLLSSFLEGQTFDDPAKLQAAVDGFLQAEAAITALGAEAVPAFTAQMQAVNDNFDAASEQARKYGLAEDNLTSARARAIASLEDARAETLRQAGVSLDIRAMLAAGDSRGAELARQAEAAAQELTAFTSQLDALAATAEDKGALLVRLEAVQAAERAAIIERFGATANSALRSALDGGALLRDLTFGANSALAPQQQYFAAISSLNAAQRDLEAGGSLSDYAAIASRVLPVARDFLGTSTRYGDLTAQIGNTVAARGGDDAGLSAMLGAQLDGFGSLESVALQVGDRTVNELQSLRNEVRRLSSTLEALISRREAA